MLSSLLHLRIPFSYFLLPIYLFSLSFAPNLNQDRLLWVFIILHFFLYPASNGYNSYFDRDEKSIGGLKNPPPVNKSLYFISLLFDGAAILLAFVKINTAFAVMVFIYGLASKAYSHPVTRLKKYPVGGWLITGFFQGFFMFLTCYVGLNDFTFIQFLRPGVLTPAMLTSVMLWGSYPLTQVYQHEEDLKRGDISMSLRLGINGTFYFTAIIFTLAVGGFVFLFISYFQLKYAVLFLVFMVPVLLFFGYWFFRVRTDASKANYSNTMLMNFISATCLNGFFIYLFLDSTHVLDAF
ncbi:MAG: UbiA family prenyltransferase [Flammeovirgaceae bacterium]|nr:MAG: UbiA family prenyltransferase [Flammeovirgaceae bacterium]